jgi:hypothetical protein
MDYLNKGGRVTVFGLKPDTPLISAVEQLAYYLANLNMKVVIKVDIHDLDEVSFAFEKTAIKDRVSLLFFAVYYYKCLSLLLIFWGLLQCCYSKNLFKNVAINVCSTVLL